MRVVYLSGVAEEIKALPGNEQRAMAAVLEKLELFGDQLPAPHSSKVQGTRLRELRPRQGRSPWRALYQRIGDEMVVAVVCPEAVQNRRGFSRGVTEAEGRLEAYKAGRTDTMTATIEATATTHEDLMGDLLQDPEFREGWEATAFARLVANQIIRYRVEHGFSQRKLALLLDIHPSQVARLEMGEHEPRLSTLRRLSRVLGLSFGIDIHPAGYDPVIRQVPHPNCVQRAVADGVETLIYVAH